jgi:hypothetical protein
MSERAKLDRLFSEADALYDFGLMSGDDYRNFTRWQVVSPTEAEIVKAKRILSKQIPTGWTAKQVIDYIKTVDADFPGRGRAIFDAFKPFFAADFAFKLKRAYPQGGLLPLFEKLNQSIDHGPEAPLVFGGVRIITPEDEQWEKPKLVTPLCFLDFWAQALPSNLFQVLQSLYQYYFAELIAAHDHSLEALTEVVVGFLPSDWKDDTKEKILQSWRCACCLKFAALVLNRADVAAKANAILSIFLDGNFVAGYQYVSSHVTLPELVLYAKAP